MHFNFPLQGSYPDLEVSIAHGHLVFKPKSNGPKFKVVLTVASGVCSGAEMFQTADVTGFPVAEADLVKLPIKPHRTYNLTVYYECETLYGEGRGMVLGTYAFQTPNE